MRKRRRNKRRDPIRAEIQFEEVEARQMLAGNGLSATYFDNDNLTGRTASRVDAKVDFAWGSKPAHSSIAADTYSVRWTGTVEAPASGTFTFYTQSDDGVRLWVDGKQIINNWTQHATREDRGTVTLTAAKKHSIKLEYFEKYHGATMKLLWSGPGTAKQIIPQSRLYSDSATSTPTPPPQPVTPPLSQGTGGAAGTGDGLAVTYYDNDNFTGNTSGRVDKTVDFNWGNNGPASGIGGDTFSARWTGQIHAQHTQEYTFHTLSDDGVRLFVNGQKIIENWTVHAPKENTGKIRLEAGKKYDIRLEYFERSAGAVARLYWSGANTAKQIIPTSQLYSAKPVTPPSPTPIPQPEPIPTPQPGNVNGLLGAYYDNLDYTGSSVTRYDPQVKFDWGTSSPHEVVGSEQWAARWTGQVMSNKTEEHTFHITTDNGARLWVDGKLLIDDWAEHAKRERSGKFFMQAGKRYDIKLEYYDTFGQATMQLRWSSPSIAKNFIPSANLFAAQPPSVDLGIPGPVAHTGFKVHTNQQVNRRPGSPDDKTLVMDGYNISNLPINHKGMNIAVTDLVPGQKAWAYRNLTVRNTEISHLYRTDGFHNDFIRIAGAAGNQDVPINITLENIWIHDGTAVPILITDGDYDTIIIRNVKITGCSVNQLQINTQRVGSVKRVIVENCPGLSVAFMGLPGTIHEAVVRNSPGARVSDSLNYLGGKSGVKITVLP